MTSFAAGLRLAGVDEQPVGPGLEPVRVLEGGQVPPRVEQGPLRGVLGEVWVAQDPARNRMQVVALAFDQRVERQLVPAHRSLDEDSIHPSVPGFDPMRGPVRGV